MVRTFTWWDHLKTRQKSVWKVKFLDFGCPVFRWLLYFNYLCSRLQRRPWSSCSFRTRKMPETKNQKLVNFFLVQYFLYLLQYFLFCPNSLEAQAWFKGGMGLPPHIGQFYIESRKIIFTDPKFVCTVGIRILDILNPELFKTLTFWRSVCQMVDHLKTGHFSLVFENYTIQESQLYAKRTQFHCFLTWPLWLNRS